MWLLLFLLLFNCEKNFDLYPQNQINKLDVELTSHIKDASNPSLRAAGLEPA